MEPRERMHVDLYGFFSCGEAPDHRRVTGNRCHCSALVEKERQWWAQSTAAYRLLQSVVDNNATTSSSSSSSSSSACVAAQRQLASEWWRRLCRSGGLPSPGLRGSVWSFLSGDGQRRESAREADRQAFHARAAAATTVAASSPVLEAILRDVPRTFPRHCLFLSPAVPAEAAREWETDDSATAPGGETVVALSTGQRQLLRLLYVYSAVDAEVGYCQGMAFVAGVMLLHAPEADAFLLFRHVMQGDRLQVRRLYLPDFPLLATLLQRTRVSVSRLLPRLHAHLAAAELPVDVFASHWFLSFFCTQLPMPVLARLWDLFLLGGWRVWVAVAVGLLRLEESALLERDMEGMLLHLQRRAHRRLEGLFQCSIASDSIDMTDTANDAEREAEALVRWFLRIPVDYIAI